jgi:hypothetical protein
MDWRRLAKRLLLGNAPLAALVFLERIEKLVSRWSNAEFLFDKVGRVTGGNVVGVLSSGVVQLALILAVLFWSVWAIAQESQGTEDRILSALRNWPRARAITAIVGLLAVAVGYELLYGRYEDTISPRMTAWGTEPYYVLVDATNVKPKFKELFDLVLIVRGQDNTLDGDTDKVIDKSRLFQVPAERVTIQLEPSQGTLSRVFPRGMIEFTLLCIPKRLRLKPEEIQTISEVKGKGGIVCDGKSASATAKIGITPKGPTK